MLERERIESKDLGESFAASKLASIRQGVVEALLTVAPDLEGQNFSDEDSFRESYDLDSADQLNLMIALSKRFFVDIPESDYPKTRKLGDLVRYLAARASA